jgi:hypothetical protein
MKMVPLGKLAGIDIVFVQLLLATDVYTLPIDALVENPVPLVLLAE